MVTSIHMLLLAVVQAATEFLPISSSGHLLFLKGLFGLEDIPIVFDVILHVGSLMAILFYFRREIAKTLTSCFAEMKTGQAEKPHTRFLIFALISTLTTFLFYLCFKGPIASGYATARVLPYTYTATTLILLSTLLLRGRTPRSVSAAGWLLPLLVGLFQGMAIMPGVSRSGATIGILLLLNIRREEAAYYSFFLAIPAILGAMVFEILEMDFRSYLLAEGFWLFIAFFVSAGFSYLFLRILTLLIRKGNFWAFSIYTFGLAVAALIIFQ